MGYSSSTYKVHAVLAAGTALLLSNVNTAVPVLVQRMQYSTDIAVVCYRRQQYSYEYSYSRTACFIKQPRAEIRNSYFEVLYEV